VALLLRQVGHRQDAVHVARRTVQGELTDQGAPRRGRRGAGRRARGAQRRQDSALPTVGRS